MNDNLRIIRDAKDLIKSASTQHCNAYNEICGGSCADAVMSVLDGELRMAEKLASLESFFSPQGNKNYADEYEINKLKNQES